MFGNPNIGTPLMVESPTSGFDLPLRMLVWEDADGTVMVTSNAIELYTGRHGIVETDLSVVIGALNNFRMAASTTPPAPDEVRFDEAVEGDISDDPANPVSIPLTVRDTFVDGTVTAGDIDYLSLIHI